MLLRGGFGKSVLDLLSIESTNRVFVCENFATCLPSVTLAFLIKQVFGGLFKVGRKHPFLDPNLVDENQFVISQVNA